MAVRVVAHQSESAEPSKVRALPQLSPAEKIAELIDKLGEAGGRKAELEADPVTTELATVTANMSVWNKELQKLINDLGFKGNEKFERAASKYRAEFGERAKVRQILDKAKLWAILGAKKAKELATIKLGDIDKYTTPAQRELFMTPEKDQQTGDRSVKISKI